MLKAPDPTLLMVRSAARWSLASLVLTAPACWLWHGLAGALCAVGGSLVVTAFFALGVVGVNAIVSAAPSLSMIGALTVYVTQLMILMIVFAGRNRPEADRPAFAIGALVATMVWQLAHTLAFARARVPVYQPPAPKEEP